MRADPFSAYKEWPVPSLFTCTSLLFLPGEGILWSAAIFVISAHDEQTGVGDIHNAPVLQWCYKQDGDFISPVCGGGKATQGYAELFAVRSCGVFSRWGSEM
jgi:hypothetical protein